MASSSVADKKTKSSSPKYNKRGSHNILFNLVVSGFSYTSYLFEMFENNINFN